jgi:hypothetical protein
MAGWKQPRRDSSVTPVGWINIHQGLADIRKNIDEYESVNIQGRAFSRLDNRRPEFVCLSKSARDEGH